ncbi:hypothetical protein OPT61_g9090 [Boeremia exigua]|uniref:Uncharacterized protein n=1 Tax=Boeremia exigua TaxID=749465 RepID=A0ACC2HVY3_9PLEO|nr:hypothetical protein OPT61_g9090 [Boeremia exigua]
MGVRADVHVGFVFGQPGECLLHLRRFGRGAGFGDFGFERKFVQVGGWGGEDVFVVWEEEDGDAEDGVEAAELDDAFEVYGVGKGSVRHDVGHVEVAFDVVVSVEGEGRAAGDLG